MKKLLALLMAVVMLLSFAACGGSDEDDEDGKKSSGKANSVESAVAIAEEVMNGNVKNLKKMIPDAVWDAREEESGDEFDEQYQEYEDSYKERAEDLKEDFGEDTEVKLSVEDKEDMSEEELEKAKAALEDTYDIDPDDVKAGCHFTMVTKYKNTDDDVEDDENEMSAIQIGSSWYLVDISEYEDEYYVYFVA